MVKTQFCLTYKEEIDHILHFAHNYKGLQNKTNELYENGTP